MATLTTKWAFNPFTSTLDIVVSEVEVDRLTSAVGSNSTLILTDDGSNQTLTFNLGDVTIVPSGDRLKLSDGKYIEMIATGAGGATFVHGDLSSGKYGVIGALPDGGTFDITTSGLDVQIYTFSGTKIKIFNAGALIQFTGVIAPIDTSYWVGHPALGCWGGVGLDNGATDGGQISFDADLAKNLKCDAAGTTLTLNGLTLTMTGNLVMGDNSVTGVDTITFTDVDGTIAGIANKNLLDLSANETLTGNWALGTPASGNLSNCTAYEGSAVLSTGEGGGTKYLREDGDGTCSWQAVAAVEANNLETVCTDILENEVPIGKAGGDAVTYTGTTGSGDVVRETSPTLVTPLLGTPTSGNLSNCTSYEGTSVLSTGEAGGTKFLREDGDNSCSWQAAMTAASSDIVTNKDLTAETNKLRHSKSVTIESPEDGDRIALFMNERAITILGVSFSSEAGTSVLFNLEYAATIASGTVIHTDTCATATPEWDVSPSGDATVPTDQIICLEITTVTGTVTQLHITFYYDED